MSETGIIEGEAVELDADDRPLPAVREQQAVIVRDEMTVGELLETRAKISEAIARVMRENEHFGAIPGAGKKKVLLKPGAELLNVLFRLAPSYHHEMIWGPGDHLTVVSDCTLTHAPTGMVIATGSGLCSTREAKYAYRQGQRTCPECGKATVRVGKARGDRPGNWYCWAKPGVSDGCGATWTLDSDQARAFEAMDTGRVENPDLPDAYNTVVKMADKRSLVAATLNGTAASDFFTQDLEDERSEERQTTERVQNPEGAKVPRSWADCEALMAQYPAGTVELWRAYGAAAKAAVEAGAPLEGTMFQATARVTVGIADRLDPASFPPPTEADFQQEWAKVLGGTLLEPPAFEAAPEGAAESVPIDGDALAQEAQTTVF